MHMYFTPVLAWCLKQATLLSPDARVWETDFTAKSLSSVWMQRGALHMHNRPLGWSASVCGSCLKNPAENQWTLASGEFYLNRLVRVIGTECHAVL